MATVTMTTGYGQPGFRKIGGPSAAITMPSGAAANSDVIDKRGYGLIGLILPSLTSTTLKVQVCDTATGTFVDLYTRGGTAVSWATETGSKCYDVPELGSVNFFRLQSSVDQTTTKTIVVQAHV